MKNIAIALLVFVLASTALARVSVPGVDGKVVIGQKILAADLIAACAHVWYEQTCGDNSVASGICAQPDGTPWPTVTCTQPRVDNSLCRARDLGLEIPSPAECRAWVDNWHKEVLRNIALNGYNKLREIGAPVIIEPDPVEDDQ